MHRLRCEKDILWFYRALIVSRPGTAISPSLFGCCAIVPTIHYTKTPTVRKCPIRLKAHFSDRPLSRKQTAPAPKAQCWEHTPRPIVVCFPTCVQRGPTLCLRPASTFLSMPKTWTAEDTRHWEVGQGGSPEEGGRWKQNQGTGCIVRGTCLRGDGRLFWGWFGCWTDGLSGPVVHTEHYWG